MRRRDWWIGVAIVAGALLLHASFPRYEWRQVSGGGVMVRIDHWRGITTVVRPTSTPTIQPSAATTPAKGAEGPDVDPIARQLGLVPVPNDHPVPSR